jgi:organic radical activating enzyme
VGYPQLFIRFAGCNLCCRYCDTPSAQRAHASVEATPGKGDFLSLPNPVEIPNLLPTLRMAAGLNLHSWSLTGGEPLLYPAFIAELVQTAQPPVKIYLETNGTLRDALTEVIEYVDIIAMDIKLPSTSGLPPLWRRHRDFLRVAARKEVFVKVVVDEETKDDEMDTVASLIAGEAADIPLILQPVSTPEGPMAIKAEHLFRLYRRARAHLKDVRVIPQVHRVLGCR